MKENKSFKAFRGTLSESEYSEVLTGYGNRSAHKDDAGLHHTNSPGAMAGINGMLASIGRGTYLDPNQAFLKIKLRLNAVLLDFDWKNGSWDGGVGTYDIPVRQYGRVDGYDAATGGIRFDGRAAPTAGLKEFTMHCEVAEMDGLYTVTASISAAGMGMVGESVDDLVKSKSKELTWHAPKKSMAKIELNPKKKIGYKVTAIGPGGKKTVEKSVDEGFASAKKEIKRELAKEKKVLTPMLPVPFFKGLEGPNRGRGTGYWASTPASTPVRRGGGRPAGAGAPIHPDQQSGMKPIKLGKGRRAGAGGVSEQLVGGQKKLDLNKNKRLDSHDFKMLRAKKTTTALKEGKGDYYAVEGTVDGQAAGAQTSPTSQEAIRYAEAMFSYLKKQNPKTKKITVHIFKVVNYQREDTPVKVLKVESVERHGDSLAEGTGYSDEEVKSGKQRSGRPHPEARFPGWKVGKNMLTQKVKNGKKIGAARTIAAVSEETERAAEARHKRLMKMDIPGTFGDRDLRERIRAKRERQKQQQAAKAAAAKASKPVQEEAEQVNELSKPLLKRFSIAATKKADRLEAEGDYHSQHLQGLMAAEKAGKPIVGKPPRISQLRQAAYDKSDRLRAASVRAQKRAE